MKNKIDKLREDLHRVVKSSDNAKILKISQELDELIIEFYKEQGFEKQEKTN